MLARMRADNKVLARSGPPAVQGWTSSGGDMELAPP
jgi:hypothetical protein